MDEKTRSGGAANKLGSSSVLHQDKGSKNKRKLDDPSLENLVNVHLSMTEFPCLELPPEIFRIPAFGPLEVGSSSARLTEEFEPADWDDPIACQLEELLLSNLYTIFQNAIKKIVECGYEEDIAEKAVSRCGLYQGGKDLVSNVVNDALASLKKGKEGDISSQAFEDLRQLVEYTMLEMISVLREVKPSLSIAEAMWWLLMYDLNISVACEVEGDLLCNFGCKEVLGESSSGSTPQSRSETQNPETISVACEVEGDLLCNFGCKEVLGESSSGSTPQSRSETQNPETICPNPNEPNVSKPSFSCSENYLPETLKFGSFHNLSNPKNLPLAYEGLTPEKESLVSMGAYRDYGLVASVSEEKSGTGRKGCSKKELAALWQKSFNLEKYRAYGKDAFRAGKLATIGSFDIEKETKFPSELSAEHMKNASSKVITEAGALTDESHHVLTKSSPGLIVADKSSTPHTKGAKSAVPTTNTERAPMSSLKNKPVPKSEARTSVSSKRPDNDAEKKPAPEAKCSTSMSSKSTDYCAGIPYDESLGKYIPQDEKDKLILNLIPKLQELQHELHCWTQWTNQKVMQAARRLSKDQTELKSLRQEKEEAEQLKREKQIMEENTMKRLSEMEFALNNATSQVEDANCTVQKLEVEHSLLKMEMEAAKLQAAQSAARCREALEREQKAVKDVHSWDGQRSLLQQELTLEKQKAAELQRKVGKAKSIYNQSEMTWKQEKMAKEKFLAQAASIRKERVHIEAAAKVEEDKIKLKAEKDLQKYGDEIKKIESKLSVLKMKLDSSKIAALRRGTDGGNRQSSSVNQGNQIPGSSKRAVDIKDYSGSRGLKQEHECVMCLSEEKIVVFFPCAHQVLCFKCNELHEKQGMKDCPACRTPIVRRICACFAKS